MHCCQRNETPSPDTLPSQVDSVQRQKPAEYSARTKQVAEIAPAPLNRLASQAPARPSGLAPASGPSLRRHARCCAPVASAPDASPTLPAPPPPPPGAPPPLPAPAPPPCVQASALPDSSGRSHKPSEPS